MTAPTTVKCREYIYKRVKEGSIVGRLTVVEVVGRSKNGSKIWKCVCSCGNEKDVISSSLNSGLVQSCGCRYDEIKGVQRLSHGLSHSPTYNSWRAMHQRCYYNGGGEYYAAKGIVVCDRWHTFANFLADMGERPEGHSIDRIDPNGNYEPNNCRWATASLQSFNTSMKKNNTSGRSGVGFHKQSQRWVAQIAKKHIGMFSSYDDAVVARTNAEIELYGFTKD